MSVNDLDRVLTTKGYAIKKKCLTEQEAAQLRRELTVCPMRQGKPAGAAFPIYLESPVRFYVPRMYGREKFGKEEKNIVPQGLPLPKHIKFKGTPFDYQEEIISSFINSGANGLICVPCGRGKTFMALAIAIRRGKRFLIIVDKEFLMDQWESEIKTFIEGARVGFIRGSKCEIDPNKYDITICMIQTICSRDFPQGTFSGYDLSIFDECHHLGPKHFSQTLQKIQTFSQLGLSATPVRKDGLTNVFEKFLGPPLYWEKFREPDDQVVVRCIKFSTDEAAYNEEQVNRAGEIVIARMLTQIVKSPERNNLIAKLLKDLIAQPSKNILVISERRKHLETIYELIKDYGVPVGYYIGGMTTEQRYESAAKSRILLGSYAMASEAMNNKKLNTMILASPRKDVAQSTGRILRERKETRTVAPLIIDIVDSHWVYKKQWRERSQYYKQCAYKIKKYTVGKEEDEEKEEISAPLNCLVLEDN